MVAYAVGEFNIGRDRLDNVLFMPKGGDGFGQRIVLERSGPDVRVAIHLFIQSQYDLSAILRRALREEF